MPLLERLRQHVQLVQQRLEARVAVQIAQEWVDLQAFKGPSSLLVSTFQPQECQVRLAPISVSRGNHVRITIGKALLKRGEGRIGFGSPTHSPIHTGQHCELACLLDRIPCLPPKALRISLP